MPAKVGTRAKVLGHDVGAWCSPSPRWRLVGGGPPGVNQGRRGSWSRSRAPGERPDGSRPRESRRGRARACCSGRGSPRPRCRAAAASVPRPTLPISTSATRSLCCTRQPESTAQELIRLGEPSRWRVSRSTAPGLSGTVSVHFPAAAEGALPIRSLQTLCSGWLGGSRAVSPSRLLNPWSTRAPRR